MTGHLAGSRRVSSTAVRLVVPAFLIALLVAQAPVLMDLTLRGVVYENQGITDLGRDLVGVSVVEQGGIPYGQIGDLISEFGAPHLPLSGPPRLSGWVVHPPLALAGARALLAISGSEAEAAGRCLGVLFTLGLAVAIVVMLTRYKQSWAIAVGLATLVWVPTFTDTIWIQGNALAGLALLTVILLEGSGRRTTGRIVLGLLVAWKPWLAVFALALPGSSSVLKDLAWVAATAVVATLASLPFVGGLDALWAWITEALPGNAVEARETPSNLSWTSLAGSGVATLIYVGVAGAIPLIRRRLPRQLWLLLPVGIATALAPFVWDHYWLALAPVVWFVASRAEFDLRIPVFAWTSLAILPVALARLGQSGMENRVLPMVLAGTVLLLGTVVVAGRVGTGQRDADRGMAAG